MFKLSPFTTNFIGDTGYATFTNAFNKQRKLEDLLEGAYPRVAQSLIHTSIASICLVTNEKDTIHDS